MKFGVFLMPQHPRSDDPVRRFRETAELARLARDAGFDCVAAGHHYLSPPYQSLQSVPLLSRLAADTGSMDLCLSVLLLALLNPVQVAEEIASLDVMSEGRVVFGIGIGYREVEYEAFGMQRQQRVPRMLEALELIKRLWTEEAVATARPFLEAKYAAYAEWGQDKALPGEESFRVPFDELARDRFILGTPDEVIEQIEERVRRLQSNYLIFRMGWPGMEAPKILRVIEMMGEKVLPHFHAKYGRG